MRKVMILAVLLSIVMSVSAQIYTFKASGFVPGDQSEFKEIDITFTIKDGAWCTDGIRHIIMFNTMEKIDNGTDPAHFTVNGIDWEGEECVIALTKEGYGVGSADVLAFKWGNTISWYIGELKHLK